MAIDPRHLLDSVLEGEEVPTISHIKDLMKLPEGQHLEFKDGLAIKTKEHRRELREAVNAFGNSSGGLLVVGVDENEYPKNPRGIRPCEPPGREPLDKWAENLITPMEAYFSPLPKIQVVDDGEGPILVLAVPRAPRLVPIPRSGEMAYFLRLNQSTLQAPPYLLSDLMLGRRQHPRVRIREARVSCRGTYGTGIGKFRFHFEVENDGLIQVEQLIAGVVSWSQHKGVVNSHLRTYVEIVKPDNSPASGQLHPVQLGAACQGVPAPRALRPFEHLRFEAGFCRLPSATSKVTAAVYLLPAGSEPIWYEVTFQPPSMDGSKTNYEVASDWDGPITGRPRVSWE